MNFGARIVVEDFQPGWRALTAEGFAVPILIDFPTPRLDWERLFTQILSASLDRSDARSWVAKILPKFACARHPKDAKSDDSAMLVKWKSEDVTDPILLRVRALQATLQLMNSRSFDAVDEITEEHVYKKALMEARGEALNHTSDTATTITEQQIEACLKQWGGDVPLKRAPIVSGKERTDPDGILAPPDRGQDLLDALDSLSKEKGWNQSEVIKHLMGSKYPPNKRFPVKAQSRLRQANLDRDVAEQVSQYLINVGQEAITSNFFFAEDGVPTVGLYANEPFAELVLRAHAQRTLPKWLMCKNPRCKRPGPFRPEKSTKVFCSDSCRDHMKKIRARSIDRARKDWSALTGPDRSALHRISWIAERSTYLATERAGGAFVIQKNEIAPKLTRKA